MLIFYGITGNKRDVTEICLTQLKHDDIITIPNDDHKRSDIFGDHLPGNEKKVFVVVGDDEYEYDKFQTIKINVINSTIKNVYSAVIVEFRQHQALKFVLSNFLNNLSDEWEIIIFCGNLNTAFVDNIIAKLESRITKYQLNIDNLLPDEYSKLLMERYIYDNIPTETFLIFQTDSIILKENKDKINQFLKYDYVGAPWNIHSTDDVGNGGLSLRKKSKMLEIIEKDESRKHLPEDLFFAQSKSVSLYKPLPADALLFSIENYHGNNHPFGCHKPWGIMGTESDFCQMYHEINKLYNLQYCINNKIFCTYMLFYGIDGNKKDVTEICFNQLMRDNIITIPNCDHARSAIFGDHVPGIEKKIFVIIEETEYEYDMHNTVKINTFDSTIQSYHFKPILFIFYGTVENKKNVTEICLNQNCDIITIPNCDFERAAIFGDHLPGTEKKIFVIIQKNDEYKTYEYGPSQKISINVSELTIHSIDVNKINTIHNSLQIKHGKFADELPEQILSANYLTGNEKVLEIGSNVGRNSLVIASIVKDFVTLETDANVAAQLAENRDLNHFTFHIENSALSKRKLIQSGWETKPSNILESGFSWVNTITLDQLNAKYKIEFDTLILDCEGAFYYILMDMPEILKNINLIIVENDYHDISHKHYVDSMLKKHNFYVQYQEAGGWGCCYNMFYEVWKKR